MDRMLTIGQSIAAAAVAVAVSLAISSTAQAADATAPSASRATPAVRYERLTRDNAVLLIVDHQVGLYTGVRDIDTLQLKHNIVGLTKAALALKVPVIVTTTTEKMWGR